MKYIPQNKLAKWRKENTPEVCPILGCPMIDPVVDHCHRTGLIRGVISREANSLVGKIENFFYRYCESKSYWTRDEVIHLVAKYLESNKTNILHPVGAKQLTSRFARMRKGDQVFVLKKLGARKSEINACVNSKERSILYGSLIKNTTK